MRREVGRIVVAAAAMFLSSAIAFAFFSAEATKVSDFSEVCRSVVIAPMECPATLDCLWLERELGAMIREKGKLKVVDAQRVRQKMFDLGLDDESEDLRKRILDEFKADAVVVVSIGGVESRTRSGGAGFWTGQSFFVVPDERKAGQAELVFLDRDGKKLLRGSGNGESHNPDRTEKGLVKKVLRLILEKAFPSN